jgi:multidrug transporter EmrE-like cation transporter
LGQLLIKAGSLELNQTQNLLSILTNIKLLAGIGLFGFSFLTWIYILTKSNLSYAFPFAVGLGYVAIIALSVLVLKEPIAMTQRFGILFVGVGVILMSLQTPG